MNYSDITIEDIYWVCLKHRYPYTDFSMMAAWIEANMIFDVRRILIDWYRALEDDTAKHRHPDPFNTTVTPEIADWYVKNIDEDFELEKLRWPHLQINSSSNFSRLKSPQRLAMAQELFSVLVSLAGISDLVYRYVQENKQIIPPELVEKTEAKKSENWSSPPEYFC